MDTKKIRVAIFDFDGTLYDNSGIAKTLILSHLPSIKKMAAERKARRELKGRDDENKIQFENSFYSRAAFHARTTPQKFQVWYEKHYLKFLQSALSKKAFRARPDIDRLFDTLDKAGVKIAVYSDYACVKERMAACGISSRSIDLCGGFYCSNGFGCLKPAPRGFLQIAANFAATPKQCLVIGDRDDTDGEGARHAGMEFIQVKTKKENPVKDTAHKVLEWRELLSELGVC